MRCPVAEIKRARLVRLERIAAVDDVREVQLGRAADDGARRVEVARGDRGRGALDRGEERGILEKRDLHGLAETRAKHGRRQRRQHRLVAHHRVRHSEGADEVLLAEAVDAVLDAHRGVVLRERRRRHAHEAHAAVRGRCAEADGIKHRAAADREHEALAVDLLKLDEFDHAVDHRHVVLRALAAGAALDRHDARHVRAVRVEVRAQLLGDAGLRSGDAFVDQHHRAARRDRGVAGEHLAQRVIRCVERPAREAHAMRERRRNRAVMR